MWACFGSLATVAFLVWTRRAQEDECVRKLSQFWHVAACVFWFFLHIFRVTAFYGWYGSHNGSHAECPPASERSR